MNTVGIALLAADVIRVAVPKMNRSIKNALYYVDIFIEQESYTPQVFPGKAPFLADIVAKKFLKFLKIYAVERAEIGGKRQRRLVVAQFARPPIHFG